MKCICGKIQVLFCLFFILVHGRTYSADTLFVSINNVDSIFISNNLLLLAEAYNIDAERALVLSAKAYPNPVFTFDLNVYDPQNNIPFHVGSTGQKQFILEQLILIGGKHKTEIDIAKKNVQVAELDFEDLIRRMYFELHSSFYRINNQYELINIYDKQLVFIDTLVQRYQVQVSKGNVPLKDFTRLESIFFKLNNARSEAYLAYVEELKEIQMLLNTTKVVIPIVSNQQFFKYTNTIVLDTALLNAFTNRPDYKVSNEEVQLSLLELKLQKRMVIPDIKLNLSYDQRGGAFLNQVNSGLTIPIPLWSHNRGMVRFSKARVSVAETYLGLKKVEIENDVNSSFYEWQISVNEYNMISQRFNADFTTVYNGMVDNFTKRNISMIEFADFVESYNETIIIFEMSKVRLAIQAEKMNLVTATNQF
jgi:cobalt-zinc-cadmium efflux system outer membrane protein